MIEVKADGLVKGGLACKSAFLWACPREYGRFGITSMDSPPIKWEDGMLVFRRNISEGC